MAQMDCHQTTLEPRFSDKCGHSIGEFIEPAALGCDQQFFKSLTKHNDRACWREDPLKTGRFLDQPLFGKKGRFNYFDWSVVLFSAKSFSNSRFLG